MCVDHSNGIRKHYLATLTVIGRIGRALLLSAVFGVYLTAQSESGSAAIEGLITDPDGRAVSGAQVTVRNLDTGYTRAIGTDAGGRYSVQVLPVGTYVIEANAPGFAIARRNAVRLTVGNTETVNLGLTLAPIDQQVTVSSDPVGINREEIATSTNIELRAVTDLPIRGRNFTEFAQLTPAIVQESDRNGLVISGQRSINSNVAIDGADFNDPLQGNQRGGNEAVFFFPQTAVREFQVLRSGAGAEVGRTNAGFVNVVTKSGTNAWHGEGFYFNRNKALTSSDAFGRSLNNQQNQFGGSVGGPLRRDRTFFFVAAEQNFLRVPFFVQFQKQPAQVVVPADLLALQGEYNGTNNPTAVFARNDFILNPNHFLNLQYTYTRLHGQNFNFDSAQLNQSPTTNYTRIGTSHGLKGALVSVLTTNVVNEVRAQVATDDRHERRHQRTNGRPTLSRSVRGAHAGQACSKHFALVKGAIWI